MNNIEKGIQMTVAAKLREKGVPAAAADAIATSNAADARKVFETAVRRSGGKTENAYEAGLGAVSEWAATLNKKK